MAFNPDNFNISRIMEDVIIPIDNIRVENRILKIEVGKQQGEKYNIEIDMDDLMDETLADYYGTFHYINGRWHPAD